MSLTFYVLRFAKQRIALSSLFLVGILLFLGLVAMPPDALTHHVIGAKLLGVRNVPITPSGRCSSCSLYLARVKPAYQAGKVLPSAPRYLRSRSISGRSYICWPE